MGNLVDSSTFKKILQRNVMYPLVICIVICGVFIGLFIHMINLNNWVDHTNKVLSKSYEITKLMIDAETGFRGYLLTEKESFLEPYINSNAQIENQFSELKEMVNDNPTQVQQAQVFISLYHSWKNNAESVLEKMPLPRGQVKQGALLRKDMMDAIRLEIRRFVVTETKLRDERVEEVKAQTKFLVIVTVSLSLFAGGFLAMMGRKQLLALSESYEDSLRTQSEQNLELSENSWLRTGEAELGFAIKGELTLGEIGQQAMDFFSTYTKSSIGTLFVMRDGHNLERVASYGFSESESPNAKKNFALGEGVVGTSAVSKKVIRMSQLPSGYLKVASSLGATSPVELIVVPLIAGGIVEGVLELGFMHVIGPREEKLMEQISDILGTALKSALYRDRLQQLLEETQVQAEELQAQQEELKVSNEELTERSRSLSITQTKLEAQHAELEQTNTELENQKLMLDEQNRFLRITQKELERKSKDVEESSKYKSEFMANMSHELRTPLNSTLILSKLLKDNSKGNLTKEQVEYAATIYTAGNDLLNLINDILDLSKVEAGKLEIYAEKFSVDEMTGTLRTLFMPIVREKKINLVLKHAEGTPDFITTDRLRVEQILKNLLSNAVKFTSDGEVRLDVSSGNNNEISFKVSDTGIGIKPEQLETIFEAFRQADGTTNRKYGGTGLGLTISRNLASLLGGRVEVSSVAGKGSTFTLTIPVRTESIQNEPMVQPGFSKHLPEVPEVELKLPHIDDDLAKLPAPGRKVLMIVEDEKTFADVLVKISRERNFLCLVAQTCKQAMRLAQEHLPDAIVLDMKLPDGLGLALLDQLKENSKTRHIPVHVISSADFSREALHLGAVGYLQKPSEIDDIKKSIGKLEEKIDQKMKKVLIVEDDDVQRHAIERLIEGEGVQITSVHSGIEAFEMMRNNIFDCAIVDLALSDISGFKLLEMIRNQSEFLSPPVIIYTGRSLTMEEEQSLRQYSRTIIIKGARSPERLLSEVTLFLHQVESQLSDEKRNLLQTGRNRERDFEGQSVLLVDDDARNIFALMSLLELRGADVIVARNGVEALDQVKNNPDLNMVLMDIMMPEMDGYTAIRELRKNHEKDNLPIIALTAKAMRDDYEKCMEAGANDYLSKPVDVDKLVSLMRVWLPRA